MEGSDAVKSIAGSLAALLLAGCVATVPILARDASPPAGEAAVSGRISLWDGDKRVGPDKLPGRYLLLVLVSDASGKAFRHYVVDGEPRWHLPAGRYSITGFVLLHGGAFVKGPVGASFEVPPGAAEVCIGALALAVDSTGSRLAVEDDCDASQPAAPGDAVRVRSPLRLEDDPGGLTVDRALLGARRWGEGEVFVAEPLTPAIGQTTESLQPTLRWQPLAEGGTEGLSYDLRVYRVALDTWGPLVVARDHLRTPSYQMEKPLQRGEEYYWRVRLRRGDRVSPWSWYDRTLILVVYNSWTRGAPFSFSTSADSR